MSETAATDITLSVAGWIPCQRLSVDEFEDVPGDVKNRLPVPLQDPLRKQPARKRVFKTVRDFKAGLYFHS